MYAKCHVYIVVLGIRMFVTLLSENNIIYDLKLYAFTSCPFYKLLLKCSFLPFLFPYVLSLCIFFLPVFPSDFVCIAVHIMAFLEWLCRFTFMNPCIVIQL